MHLTVVAVLWICWCAMHSILIDGTVTNLVNAHFPGLVRYFRLLYNCLSLVTLLPLAHYSQKIGGEVVFGWQGSGAFVRIPLLAGALLLFWAGAKRYDMKSFLGLNQLKHGEAHLLLSTSRDFLPIGVFAVTRHPWYLGALLAIWTALPEYQQAVFVAVVILSFYLVVGTLLEERKIVREYGGSYRRYQQMVSMLFPWKWLKNKLKL